MPIPKELPPYSDATARVRVAIHIYWLAQDLGETDIMRMARARAGEFAALAYARAETQWRSREARSLMDTAYALPGGEG